MSTMGYKKKLRSKKMMIYFLWRIKCFLNGWCLFCRIWPLTNSRMVSLIGFILQLFRAYIFLPNVVWWIEEKIFYSFLSPVHSKYNLCVVVTIFVAVIMEFWHSLYSFLALSKTFSVKKKKGKLLKAWDGSKVIYNVASWGATAIG